MTDFIGSISLLLVLLNPFLIIIYLIDVVRKLSPGDFIRTLLRAGLIASCVFCVFAIAGDAVFSKILQADFASFRIFGGLIFLFIGFQFVFRGPTALEILRGESEHLSGAIAMPIFIGPATLSASIVIGKRMPPLLACAGILLVMVISIAIIILLKKTHDYVRPKKEPLIERYIEVAGRIMAIVVGTVAIDMIMQGLKTWIKKM